MTEEPEKDLEQEPQADDQARPSGEEQVDDQDGGTDEIQELLRNPEALDQLNQRLATEAAAEEQEQPEAQKAAKPAPSAEPDDPVVETILFRGREEQVRKSQSKGLMQKGRVLEQALEQLAPLREVAEDPELFAAVQAALKSDGGKAKLLKLLRERKEEAEAAADVPVEVPGYTKEEAAEAEPLVTAILKKHGILKPDAGAPLGEQKQYDQVVVDAHLAAAEALEDDPQEHVKNLDFANAAILEMDQKAAAGEIDQAAWARFRRDLDDPKQPRVFLRFYREMREQRRRVQGGGAQPEAEEGAAPPAARGAAPKIVVRQSPGARSGNQDRMGSGEGGSRAGAVLSAWDLTDEEFERTLRS
jgi:hypothetical protein